MESSQEERNTFKKKTICRPKDSSFGIESRLKIIRQLINSNQTLSPAEIGLKNISSHINSTSTK